MASDLNFVNMFVIKSAAWDKSLSKKCLANMRFIIRRKSLRLSAIIDCS